jgi:integrase
MLHQDPSALVGKHHESNLNSEVHAADPLEPPGAPVPRLTIHGLRHTAASLYISACTPPKVAQRILGHASVVMTMDLYGHLYPDEMDTWAARLNEVASESGVWPERGQIAGSEPDRSEEDR